MTRRTALIPALIAAAMLVACLVALLAMSRDAEAAFPGQNGRVAYDGAGGIWTARPDGTDARLVIPDGPEGEPATQPAFSPDGRRIAYETGWGRDVFVADADGTGAVRLTDDPANDAQPAWSPDGARIAFISDRDRDPEGRSVYEVYVMDADGTNQERLTTTDSAYASSPAWSPDGTRIAFNSNWGGSSDIWVMNADGTNLKNLTNSPQRPDHQPSWSPDGTRIAFDTNQFAGDVWVMDSDGTNQRNLTPTPHVGEYEPAFSPNGRKIAYARAPRNGRVPGDIWKMRASDGLARDRVTDTPTSEGFPDWGPRPTTTP